MLHKLLSLSKWRLLAAMAVTVAAITLPLMSVYGSGEAAGGDYMPPLYATFWALVPPLLAIILALITKEVFSSLFLGCFVGALLWATGPNPGVYEDGEAVWESSNIFSGTLNHLVRDGFLGQLSDSFNVGIIIFLVVLGVIVAMMARTGGAQAFGVWANTKVKTRVGAQLALMVFHLFIFIDDYFACLTVGSIMRPVTDRANISRAKLAWLIDSTAAPICILAPISTWAAAVTSYLPEDSEINGFTMFVRAIPWNFYALLTLVMILCTILMKVDFGPMKRHEENAIRGDLYTTPDRPFADAEVEDANSRGRVYDLAIPIIILIISCVTGLIYSGGFFDGASFVEAFSNADAALGLVLGSIFSIVVVIIYYFIRRLLSVKDLTEAIPKGVNVMASPILILTFAWMLKAMTDALGSREFVKSVMEGPAQHMESVLPAVVFIIAALIAFATGTSWGTYAIMIPIVCSVFEVTNPDLLIIGIAASLAGGVMGDHCSPISDTTIMASAGAQCNHINHVSTQLPYALTVGGFSFVMFLISGFVRNVVIMLPVALILFVAMMFVIKMTIGKRPVKNLEADKAA
jgi:Na+/H+ antiporter NhaC